MCSSIATSSSVVIVLFVGARPVQHELLEDRRIAASTSAPQGAHYFVDLRIRAFETAQAYARSGRIIGREPLLVRTGMQAEGWAMEAEKFPRSMTRSCVE
jgi:hypothetical protein